MQLSRHCASTFPFLADRPPVAFQRSPNRLPILRCGFHHHFLDLLLDQPLRKPLQLLGVATVPASLKLLFLFHFDVSHNHRQLLPQKLQKLSRLSCGKFGDLESEHGGFPLEKVDLMLAVLELVDLGSFVHVFHPMAQHVVHQTGQLGCHGFGCHRCP